MRFLTLLYLAIPILICSCSETDKNKGEAPNDESKKNGEYYWWVGEDGVGEWIKKSDDGTWKPTDGVLIDYWPNGKIAIRNIYKNGKSNGICTYYDKLENVYIRVSFTDSRADSLLQVYYPDSILQMNLVLKRTGGILLGANMSYFYDNGQLFYNSDVSISEGGYFIDTCFYENSNPMYAFNDSVLTIYDVDGDILQTITNPIDGLIPILATNVTSFIDIKQLEDRKPINRSTKKYGCTKGDCISGKGEYTYPNNLQLFGSFKNGLATSNCKIYDNTSALLFDGDMKYGIPNGNGTIKYQEASKTSNFVNGKLNGYSEIYYEGGAYIKGYFINDTVHDNHAEFMFENKTKAIGPAYENYLINGPATVYYNNDSMSCNLKNSQPIGLATYYYASGKIEKRKYNYSGYTIIEE